MYTYKISNQYLDYKLKKQPFSVLPSVESTSESDFSAVKLKLHYYYGHSQALFAFKNFQVPWKKIDIP